EHRLILRHDNADARLTPLAREAGLCSEERWRRFSEKQEAIARNLDYLRETFLFAADSPKLEAHGEPPIANKMSLFDLMKRPNMILDRLAGIAEIEVPPMDPRVREQVELAAMYDGYIQRQQRLAGQARKLDEFRIPIDWDWQNMRGLSYESREKLGRIRPTTVGQASRVPGVRPADIALLIGHLKARRSPTLQPAKS
ncbi:MAG TPA: hypothetical protein VG820_02375, partial [Fimbriimonadaceae bacterium]|nr:hypothetical protein [Fimbriimonadaceae bacterium]